MAATKKAQTKQPASQTNGTQQEITKMDAVKAALQQLGKNARPLDIKGFVKQKFDMDLDMDLIHNYKHILTKKKGKRRVASKPGGESQVQAQAARKTQGRNEDKISLRDIELVRELKNRLGEDNLHSLIKVLG